MNKVNEKETKANKKPDTKSKSRKSSFGLTTYFFLSILIAATIPFAISYFNKRQPRELNNFRLDLPHYEWLYEDDFFSESAIEKLNQIIRTNKILTISDDAGIEGAGEQVPAGHPDCLHPLMTYNANRTLCHFPHRLDIASHYMKTGGFDGSMEYVDKMAARLFSFRHKLLTSTGEEELKKIYGEKFLNKARFMCTKNEIKHYSLDTLVTDIFQFDVIIILPGQELPMHIDIPYFWGADRKTIPHWLLAIMKRSQLFDDIFIPQVQGVAWLSKHQFGKSEEQEAYNGGNFHFNPYKGENESISILVKSKYNAALLIDGTQVIHGVQRFKAEELPPKLEKSSRYYISYVKSNDSWNLYDQDDKFMGTYSHNEMRISIVWRVHCFQDENEKTKYKNQKERMNIDQVLKVFKDELRKKNKLPSEDLKPLDLLTILVKEYAGYPLNDRNSHFGLFSFNYCLLPLAMPEAINSYILKPILNNFC